MTFDEFSTLVSKAPSEILTDSAALLAWITAPVKVKKPANESHYSYLGLCQSHVLGSDLAAALADFLQTSPISKHRHLLDSLKAVPVDWSDDAIQADLDSLRSVLGDEVVDKLKSLGVRILPSELEQNFPHLEVPTVEQVQDLLDELTAHVLAQQSKQTRSDTISRAYSDAMNIIQENGTLEEARHAFNAVLDEVM